MNKIYLSSISEQELIDHIRQNDECAFRLLYQKYWTGLLNFAETYISDKDTCKEIVQELFIALHCKRAQLNITSSFSSYLYSSLRNRIFNYIRDQSVYTKHIRKAFDRDNTEKKNNEIEHFIDLAELNNEINDCLQQMPEKYREVFVLHKQEHYTLKKTAEILQRPIGTIEKQLRKALTVLRRYIVERNFQPN